MSTLYIYKYIISLKTSRTHIHEGKWEQKGSFVLKMYGLGFHRLHSCYWFYNYSKEIYIYKSMGMKVLSFTMFPFPSSKNDVSKLTG